MARAKASRSHYNPASLLDSITQPSGATLTFPLYGAHGHWLEMGGAVSDKRSFDAIGNPRVESAKGRRGGVLSQYFDPNRALASLGVAASDASGVTGQRNASRSSGAAMASRSPSGDPTAAITSSATTRSAGSIEQRERVDGQWHATRFEHDLAGNTDGAQPPERHARGVAVRRLRPDRAPPGAAQTGASRARPSTPTRTASSPRCTTRSAARRSNTATTRPAGSCSRSTATARRAASSTTCARASRRRCSRVPGQVLFDVGYEYDLANRLIRTRDRAAQETLVEHVIEAGQVVETHYGNGLVRAYTYDGAGLIVGSETRNAASAVIESTRIERTGETNPAAPPGAHRDDDAARLDRGAVLARRRREALGPGQARLRLEPRLGHSAHYAYDELSNRIERRGWRRLHLQRRAQSTARGASAAERALAYGYDAAGFATVARRRADHLDRDRPHRLLRQRDRPMGPLGSPRRARLRGRRRAASISSAAASRATPAPGASARSTSARSRSRRSRASGRIATSTSARTSAS